MERDLTAEAARIINTFDWSKAYLLYSYACESDGRVQDDWIDLMDAVADNLYEVASSEAPYSLEYEGFVTVNSGEKLTLAYVPVFAARRVSE